MTPSKTKKIVVGVDGSAASKAALAWAAAEARLRRDRVVAVLAWTPAAMATGPWPGMVPIPTPDTAAEEARETLNSVVQEVLGHIPSVEVEQRVVQDAPATALMEAARDAQLLVVGSRGLGEFAGLMLGSVSHECAQHSTCPVVIVREPEQKPAEPRLTTAANRAG